MDDAPRFDFGGAPRAAGAWLMLGVLALGASALCAVLLVAARTPGLRELLPHATFFSGALVLHVTLAALVWFLAVIAGFASFAAARPSTGSGRTAVIVAAAGLAAIAVSPAAGGQALLSNYVPVLTNGIFGIGLGLVAAAVLATTFAALRRAADTAPLMHRLIALALVPVPIAAASCVLSLAAVPDGLPSAAYYDVLFWGAGHTLQFTHVGLMMCAWLALAGAAGIPVRIGDRSLVALVALAAAPALAVPWLHAIFPATGGDYRRAFTLLMSYAAWPAPAALGVYLLVKSRAAARGGALRWVLRASIALFLAGCVLGSLIRSETALVPAHYHGTVGAVTLAYMALLPRLLAKLGRTRSDRFDLRAPIVYGAGLALLIAGLAVSGFNGMPRKLDWSAASGVLQTAAMIAIALGGFAAVAGAAAFAWSTARPLITSSLHHLITSSRRRDWRAPAFAMTLAAIAVGGYALAQLGGDTRAREARAPDARTAPREHGDFQRRAEIEARFTQGVAMLHAKRYDHAVTAFHRLLELAPKMPEAHVNMGYALIGLERYDAAKGFFEAAIALRERQVNAYYGLAIALEGARDVGGAIGAMRTYVHLAAKDDPYLRKAYAALWEWETRLAEYRALAEEEKSKAGSRKAGG